MKVNSFPSVRHNPSKTNYQKTLLVQVKDSLLRLDWAKHQIFFSKLRELIGCQQQIVQFLGECIGRNSKKGFLLNYLYVIDYMLTQQTFNVVLHKYLVQIYCDLFKHLLWQNNYDGLQRMKIMRKYWVKRIDFNLYAHLHEAVFKHFQVNIDWIKEQALPDIQQFYLEHLHMNYNDLYFHLPQLKIDRQHNQPKKVIYQPKSTPHTKKEEENSTTELQSNKEQKKVQVKKQKIQAKIQERARPQIQLLKRKRESSQETTISLTSKRFRYDQQNIGQFTSQLTSKSHKKQPHRQNRHKPVKVEQRGPLKGFNFLLIYTCPSCLGKFTTTSQLELHQAKSCKIQQAVKEEQKNDCVVIGEQEISNYSRTCKICFKQLETQYKNGNWIVYNSTKLTIYDVDSIIHSCCQQQVTPQMLKQYQNEPQEPNQ